MLPHLLPFWFLFVGGSPPPAWRTAAKESASPARIAWLRQPKRVAFRLFQPSHACKNMVYLGGRSQKKLFGIFHHASCNLHTHKARSMQDAVCHCIDLPLCVCMVTLRAPFCWLNKQSSRAQTKVNAACICCLGLGLCVWGPCFAGIRHAESAWPGPSITDFLQADG